MDQTLDSISDALRRFVDKIGKLSTFFIIPLVLNYNVGCDMQKVGLDSDLAG